MNRWSEDRGDGWLRQFAARHIERTGRKSTPSGVNANHSSRLTGKKDDGAVGRPHRDVSVRQVGSLHIGGQRRRHPG